MKTLFILSLVAVIAGAVGWRYYQRSKIPSIQQRAAALDEHNREMELVKSAAPSNVDEWNLTTESIRTEIAKTGEVARSREANAGEQVNDNKIVTVIKGKFTGEKNLEGLDIRVECRDGEVKLSGSVDSADQVGQAMILALKTSGVHSVVSHLSFDA